MQPVDGEETTVNDLLNDTNSNVDKPVLEEEHGEQEEEKQHLKYDREACLNLLNTINPKHRAVLLEKFGLEERVPMLTITPTAPPSNDLERAANEAFKAFTSLYYGSDAFCQVKIEHGLDLQLTVNILKTFQDEQWTSVWSIEHVVGCSDSGDYALSSDLFIFSDQVDLHLARSAKHHQTIDSINSQVVVHVANAGRLCEQMEAKMRSEIVDFYGKRLCDYLSDSCRQMGKAGTTGEQKRQLAAELCEKMY